MKVHYNQPVWHHTEGVNKKQPVTMLTREDVQQVVEHVKMKWKSFVTMIHTSPFIDEFMLATSGAMIFVASMAWREFLQNMLDSVMSIFKIDSKLLTTFLNAIIFTCVAAFVVIMIHPKNKKKEKSDE